MREAVVVASSRTPLAKSFRGSFNMTRPDDFLAHCIKDVLAKAPELDAVELEDVIVGCALPEGAQGSNVARVASIRAGLPITIAATTVNRFCSSGLQAVAMAAHQIINEGADAAIGGGVESVTQTANVKFDHNPWVEEHVPGTYMVMGDTAEVVAKRYRISRESQDEYALSSQLRTAAAQRDGLFRRGVGADAGDSRHPGQEDRRDSRRGGALDRDRRVQPPRHYARGPGGTEALTSTATAARAALPRATRRSFPTAPPPRC